MRRRRALAPGRVWLAAAAHAALVEHAERWWPLEAGGLLLGYFAVDGPDAVVTVATGPGPAAEHTRTRYRPDPEWDERQVAEHYRASGRT